MSFFKAAEPECNEPRGSVALEIAPRKRDLGGFFVRRALPSRDRPMVGPFIFFDHIGPAELPPGVGIQVRPHPHVCLATVTYLFTGEIIHRDSLGFVQPIQPGAVNLMTAGSGIVHSERAGDDLHTTAGLHGIQSWVALPDGSEEIDPAFHHYPATTIPSVEVGGAAVRVVMGRAYDTTSPVMTHSPTLYLDCRLPAGSGLTLPADTAELAAYIVRGAVRLGHSRYPEGVMLVAENGVLPEIEAREDAHIVVIGGDPVGRRHIWWNFVASSKERIERAKADWKNGRFASVPDDDEFIPLPTD